ncbi:uncharacterized protein CLUP02_03764 [Colletotrichum lupini]|uniref:Uncharacterized protein n=1 Tax=Colletotrichum lupini TaxID=145971 RepID=A0A9Q8SKU1_9PEZI|nr:uncharacterized protein CLUP02_03764 [Colletotrichum lupini]UQC78287.1 hypothetical protein CLUP02_03764 [Colletotrichum lupini]
MRMVGNGILTPQAQVPLHNVQRGDEGFPMYGYLTWATHKQLAALVPWLPEAVASCNAIAAGVEAGPKIFSARPKPADAALSKTGGRSTLYGLKKWSVRAVKDQDEDEEQATNAPRPQPRARRNHQAEGPKTFVQLITIVLGADGVGRTTLYAVSGNIGNGTNKRTSRYPRQAHEGLAWCLLHLDTKYLSVMGKWRKAQEGGLALETEMSRPGHGTDAGYVTPGSYLFQNPAAASTHVCGLHWVIRYLGPREHGWTFLTFRVRPCPPASTAPGYLKHSNAN